MFERYIAKDGFSIIPLTGNKYRINIFGVIINENGIVVPQFLNTNGYPVITAQLWDDHREYKVALLIALTFKANRIPVCLWRQLDVIQVDGNVLNCHPKNLVWKFPKGGLQHPEHSGFVFIPGFSRYAINTVGDVINVKNGAFASCHHDKGYYRYKLVPDIGNSTSIGRHRLLCLAWIPYSEKVDQLVVNHLNGIPGDDRIENLEWVTRSENNTHASKNGLKKNDSSILMRNVVTGEIQEFSGYTACANFLSLNKDTVKYRVKAKNQPVYPGFLQFKLKKDPTPWREVENPKDKKLHNGTPTKVKTRNIVTGEIKHFDSVVDSSRFTGCAVMTIFGYLKGRQNPRPIRGYDFKLSSDETPWPSYTDEEKEVFLANPVGNVSGFKVTDIKDNSEQFFTNMDGAVKFLNKTHSLISNAIRNGRLVKRRYIVKRI